MELAMMLRSMCVSGLAIVSRQLGGFSTNNENHFTAPVSLRRYAPVSRIESRFSAHSQADLYMFTGLTQCSVYLSVHSSLIILRNLCEYAE